MATLNIKDVCEGMVVADDIRNQEGALLLKQGQEIERRHIRLLKTWGIYHLEVLIEKDEESEELPKGIPQDILEQIQHLFTYNNLDHPAIRTLFFLRLEQEKQAGYKKQQEKKMEEVTPPSTNDMDWSEEKFPEIPSIINRLNNVINDYRSSSRDIAEVIKSSPSLSTKILQLANSPFYGFCCRIETISRGVTLIGTKEIAEIAIGLSIFEYFNSISLQEINVKDFFKHCLWCGVISRIIAINNGVKDTERFFVYGLIHKIGRLLLFANFPEITAYLLYETNRSKKLLTNLERELHVNHARIAGNLAKKWGLPPQLIDNITHYLNPMQAIAPMDSSIIHLADIITHAMGVGTSGDKKIPPLLPMVWSTLKLDPSILPVAIEQTQHQITPLFKVFFSEDCK